MEATSIPCPLCGGHKRIFQQMLFQQALQKRTVRRDQPAVADFVRDCSVCSGNGWVAAEAAETALREAQAWRAYGICQY
ncbi:MAG: hypothetical protein ACREOO_03570 [bacterium]